MTDKKQKYSVAIIVSIVFAALAWFFRPWLHSLVMDFYIRPLTPVFLLIIGLIVWRNFSSQKAGESAGWFGGLKNWGWRLLLLIAVLIIAFGVSLSLLILTLFVAVLFSNSGKGFARKFAVIGLFLVWVIYSLFVSDLEYLITAKNLSFEAKSGFPQVQPVRILPKAVATRYAQDALQNPQEYLGDSQIVLVDGALKRVFPRLPDGTVLYYLNKLTGFITIDVSSLERKAEIKNQEFKYAEGIGIFDNIYFQLQKKRYFVEYQEPVYLKDPKTGKWVTVVPYISYKFFPIRMPVWGGFMVVRSDGTITDHKPEEAQMLDLTRGNRVHPSSLAVYYTESYAYRLGLLNNWFIHKDQPAMDWTEDSPPPFHIATTEGFKQVVFTRPRSGSYGIFKIFIFDVTTGDRELIEFSPTTLLTGPVAASDYVKRAFPTIDYATFSIIEPRPLMIRGDLYWMFSLANNTGAGVSKTIFVNAHNNDVLDFESEEKINKFISGVDPNVAE